MRKFLLMSSALFVGGLLNGVANAACIQTPTCSSLGYTSTSSCTGGIKCPFGNYWNCTASDLNDKITEQTNKITELETQITEIKKEVSTANCLVGDILYSDMTCNSNYVVSKTPIGVVFDHSGKVAIGLRGYRRTYWSATRFDVPGVDNITDRTLAITDLDGKKNTYTVWANCFYKSCPAIEDVNRYETEGTKAGDWHLPSMGELYAIYGNVGVLNVALGKVAASRLDATESYWSSSEYSDRYAWRLDFDNGDVSHVNKDSYASVIPVLAF